MTRIPGQISSGTEVLLTIVAWHLGLWFIGPLIVADHSYIALFWFLTVIVAAHVLWISPILINRDRADVRGWGWPGEWRDGPGRWRQSWRLYGAATAVAGLLLVALGWWRDPAIWYRLDPVTFAIRLSGYLVWGTVQAFIFFGFLHTRLRCAIPLASGLTGPRVHQILVGLAAALLFAGAHYPNWPLMGFTLVAGLVWSALFYWRPNVWLLGACHALLGTILHQFVRIPMRIGPFHEDPHGYVMRTVVPGLADLIGDRF